MKFKPICSSTEISWHIEISLVASLDIQEVFYVYLNKFEIAVSQLFLIVINNDKLTLVNHISRNAQSPRKYLLILFAGLKQSLKMSSQNLSI